eukprot:jgi/Tetstr1/442292/TSEL_030433.t1
MYFETLRRLRYHACRGDWAFSFDLEDGYYATGLREDVRDYHTIDVRGTLWRFAALPGQLLYLAIQPARCYLHEAHNAMASYPSWSGGVKLTRQLIRDLVA